MTYKLKDLPSPRATISELTDFVEIECIKSVSKSFNLENAARVLGILSDDNEIPSIQNDEEDITLNKMIDVTREIENRIQHSGNKYPFYLTNNGYTLNFYNKIDNTIKYSYLYLLFLTRLRITGPKGMGFINGINGALLFEAFSLNIIRNYFGSRAEGLIFGTSAHGSFKDKINNLIKLIGEGGSFNAKDVGPVYVNDSKLDAVVWTSFKDKRGSKVICFIQCKTGTSWKENVNQLIPSQFIKKWFSMPVSLDPINAFAIADILRDEFNQISMEKLFFDRCRLMDYLDNSINEILEDIILWTNGAIEYASIQ